ncbi:hypothetical protein NQ317_006231 [Molorchus minor]|uniref:Uncharacterized protein n=1 Tax=Molorchus minor TaxID=1323400 RepID=A0ABQ9K5Y1_9CUCU|nr:hypothetical protein NQ317_006231 [Molorchus minor]
MQVATLFRESSTLLGATMESGGGGLARIQVSPASALDHCPMSPITTRNMKLEPHDDGYETSADMLLNTASVTHNHEVKCEKLEDPTVSSTMTPSQ